MVARALVALNFALASALADLAAEEEVNQVMERGWAKFKERDNAGALAEVSTAIALQPNDPLLYVVRGVTHAIQRDYDKALADFNEAIRLNPKSHDAYAMRGLLWIETGDREKPTPEADKAIELKPDAVFSYDVRSEARRLLDDFEGAIADADRALDLKPNWDLALRRRGMARLAKGDSQEGIADLGAAATADPTNAESWFWRGVAHHDLRNWKEALADFRRANEIGGWEWSLLRTWVVRSRLGERVGATGELRAGLKAARAKLRPGCNVAADWAHEIGRLLLGEVTEADLLASATGPTKAATANKTMEACYFAGMRRLFEGDKPGAVALLRSVLRADNRSYSEYGSSLVELQELLLGMHVAPWTEQGPAPKRAAGLRVTRILDGGPAQVAGLKDGDILATLGGKEAALPELRRVLIEAERGSKLPVEFLRGEQRAVASLIAGP
ncbi:MAG: tetratricopeptide repeat protein [Planctomycetes bacterium]|nr:tetratricopeptide repeat protein [Planctomycetota bacterium]